MAESVITISTKGQFAIPKSVRECLKLLEGTQMVLRVDGNELRLRKADTWQDLRGMLAGSEADATAALLEERRMDRTLEE